MVEFKEYLSYIIIGYYQLKIVHYIYDWYFTRISNWIKIFEYVEFYLIIKWRNITRVHWSDCRKNFLQKNLSNFISKYVYSRFLFGLIYILVKASIIWLSINLHRTFSKFNQKKRKLEFLILKKWHNSFSFVFLIISTYLSLTNLLQLIYQ